VYLSRFFNTTDGSEKEKHFGKHCHNSMLIKIQPDATVCRYLFTAESLYMFRVSQYLSSGVLKTVTAATGTATSLRGLQATLEGSSCTSIMTCAGGCGYSV